MGGGCGGAAVAPPATVKEEGGKWRRVGGATRSGCEEGSVRWWIRWRGGIEDGEEDSGMRWRGSGQCGRRCRGRPQRQQPHWQAAVA